MRFPWDAHIDTNKHNNAFYGRIDSEMIKTLKKTLTLALVLALVLGLLLPAHAAENKKLRIVTTVFPQYDWIRNILGDRVNEVELTLLQDSGVDLHNFQPSAQDIMKVSSADLFAYIGGVSDYWVDNALSQAVNKDMIAVNLMKELGDAVKADMTVEGMQEGEHSHSHGDHDHDHDHDHDEHEHEEAHEHEDHDHDHEHDHDHDHDHEGVRIHNHDDEHIWLSLRNAASLTQVLADRLSRLDPDHATAYQKNAAAYIGKLKALDAEYSATADAASVKTLLFADRFPFRYLMDDYGLKYYAAFTGCSAETEASFETVTFLSKKTDELSLSSVLVLEGADKTLASTIIANTQEKNQQVVVMDSMQSVDRFAIEKGASYLGIMESNLQALKNALK